MRDFKGYELVKISADVAEDKWKKAVRSGKITLKADDLKGTQPLLLHPANAKAVLKAQAKNRGVTSMTLAASDILYDLQKHETKSVWSWMEGFKTKKAYNWVFEE